MKQITIYEFLGRNADIMNAEYVAFDPIFGWTTFCKKPSFGRIGWDGGISIKDDFRIAPFDGDWKDSLIKVEHNCSSSGQVKEPSINIEDFASPHPTGFMSESQLKRMFEHKEEE